MSNDQNEVTIYAETECHDSLETASKPIVRSAAIVRSIGSRRGSNFFIRIEARECVHEFCLCGGFDVLEAAGDYWRAHQVSTAGASDISPEIALGADLDYYRRRLNVAAERVREEYRVWSKAYGELAAELATANATIAELRGPTL